MPPIDFELFCWALIIPTSPALPIFKAMGSGQLHHSNFLPLRESIWGESGAKPHFHPSKYLFLWDVIAEKRMVR